jgi:hypothetical protein
MTPEEIEDVIDHILLEVRLSSEWQPLKARTDDCVNSTERIPTSLLEFSTLQTATSMMKL